MARKRHVQRIAFVLVSACSAVGLAQTPSAWLTGVDGSWTDGTKWSTTPTYPNNGTPPGTTYAAALPIQLTPYTVSLADAVTISTLNIVSNVATLAFSGGTLNITTRMTNGGNIVQTAGMMNINSTDSFIADVHGAGQYTQTGGTMSFGQVLQIGATVNDTARYNLSGTGNLFGGRLFVGVNFGDGTFTQDAGSVNLSVHLDVGDGTLGVDGNYILNGGSITTLNEYIGGSTNGTFTQNGGTNIVPAGLTNSIVMGDDAEATGTYYLNAGTLQSAAMVVGHFGDGTMLQSGGDATVGGVMRIGRDLGSTGFYSLSNNGVLNVSGEVDVGMSGFGTFNQTGGQFAANSTLYVGKTTTGRGRYTLSAGTLVVNGSEFVGDAGLGTFNQTGGFHHVSGTLITSNSTGAGTITLGAGTLNATNFVNNGTYSQSAGAASFGPVTGNGSISASGFGATLSAESLRTNVVSLSSGAVATVRQNGTNTGTSRINTLSIAGGATPTATLDLKDNDLILVNATYQNTIEQIAYARFGGSWGRPGIKTTLAGTDRTLGTLTGAEYKSVNGATATFDSFAVANSDILVKYTYYGDTDFNGKVDGADYSRIDTTFNNEVSTQTDIGGWLNGDFDYNNKVDGADYALIDSAFNSQTGTLRPSAGGFSNVPEPATAMVVLAASLLARRRSRS